MVGKSGDVVLSAVSNGKHTKQEIVQYCQSQDVPKTSAYRTIASQVKRWGSLSSLNIDSSHRPIYVHRGPALEKLFDWMERSTPDFSADLLSERYRLGLGVSIETKANFRAKKCTVRVAVVYCLPDESVPRRYTLLESKDFYLGEVRRFPLFFVESSGTKGTKFTVQGNPVPTASTAFVLLFTVNHPKGLSLAPFLVLKEGPANTHRITRYVSRTKRLAYDEHERIWRVGSL